MDYKQEYKMKIKENVNNVLDEIETKEMKLKIQNWSNKFGYDIDEITKKVIEDEIFRCVFSKDPSKQNLY